jgi:hypothetical protein
MGPEFLVPARRNPNTKKFFSIEISSQIHLKSAYSGAAALRARSGLRNAAPL